MKRRNESDNLCLLDGEPLSDTSLVLENDKVLSYNDFDYDLLHEIPLKYINEDINSCKGDETGKCLEDEEHFPWREQSKCLTGKSDKIPEVQNDFYLSSPTKQMLYSRAASNLKSYLHKKKLSKSADMTSSFHSLGEEPLDKCDMITQTICNRASCDKSKNREKSSQTKRIFTKNMSVSTEPTLKNNKSLKQSSISDRQINTQASKKNPSKSTIDHTVDKPYNFNTSKNKTLNDVFSSSFNTDGSSGNESKFDEITLLSNSKLISFNQSMKKIESVNKNKPTKELSPKVNTKELSFWDNLPIKSALEKIRLSSIAKSLSSEKKHLLKEEVSRKVTNEGKSINGSTVTSKRDLSKDNRSKGDINKYNRNKGVSSKERNQTLLSESVVKRPPKIKFIRSSGLQMSRSFYLNQYDELVKSYLNIKDRRIKSVSAKNDCTIKLEGPFNPQDISLTNVLSLTKVVYKCVIVGENSENLDKCVNYLKETFPNTYLGNGIRNLLK